MRYQVALYVCALAIILPAAAKADTFSITFRGTGPGQTLTFSLPSSPVPSSFVTGLGFVETGVAVDVNGTPETTDVYFGASGIGWALIIADNLSLGANPFAINMHGNIYGLFDGSPVYSGSVNSPTFLTGNSFRVVNSESSVGIPVGTYNLSITNSSSVVPEPSSIALLGTGLFGAFGVMRRRVFSR